MTTRNLFRAAAAGLAALALSACVEGQGVAPPLSPAGHLTGPQPPDDETDAAPNASVIAEAGGRRSGQGARLLGQSRSGAPAATRISGEAPLTGAPIGLALTDAPIADAAAIVLGDALGLTYVVDPGVSGTVTFRADPPLPPQDLLT
ncbi:MAG: hypothetical protein AAFP78_16910, partial [Pseudomonadota bacterium]